MTKPVWTAVFGAAATLAMFSPALAAPEPSRPGSAKPPAETLAFVSGSRNEATFLAPGSIVWNNRSAVFITYSVFEPPASVDGKLVAQGMKRQSIDCDARAWRDLGSQGLDKDGQSLISLPEQPSAEPIQAGSAQDALARVVCDKVEPPAAAIVHGYAAARAMARLMLVAKP